MTASPVLGRFRVGGRDAGIADEHTRLRAHIDPEPASYVKLRDLDFGMRIGTVFWPCAGDSTASANPSRFQAESEDHWGTSSASGSRTKAIGRPTHSSAWNS